MQVAHWTRLSYDRLRAMQCAYIGACWRTTLASCGGGWRGPKELVADELAAAVVNRRGGLVKHARY
jgi:hypothetical protein